jgi:hypothetical protein
VGERELEGRKGWKGVEEGMIVEMRRMRRMKERAEGWEFIEEPVELYICW